MSKLQGLDETTYELRTCARRRERATRLNFSLGVFEVDVKARPWFVPPACLRLCSIFVRGVRLLPVRGCGYVSYL